MKRRKPTRKQLTELLESLELVIDHSVEKLRDGKAAELRMDFVQRGLPLALYTAIVEFEQGKITREQVRTRYFEAIDARRSS